MPRKPRIRPNYLADAQYLHRFAQAVEEDRTRPFAWRSEVMQALQGLSLLLSQDPNGQVEEIKIQKAEGEDQGQVKVEEQGQTQKEEITEEAAD